MHVLLVYANRPRITFGYLPGPYGLETIRSHVIRLPVECEIINPFLSLDPKACIRRAVRPDTALIGISVRNLDDALVLWNPASAQGQIQTESCIEDAKIVFQQLRDCAPQIPIVLGGAAFAHMPVRLLEYLGADVGFAGTPEDDFARLVAALVADRQTFHKTVESLPRVVFRDRGARSVDGAVLPKLNSQAPVLHREHIYFRFRPEAAVRTFAGCPLACSHCIEHVASRKIARSPLSTVADEIEGVIRRYPEVKRIFFADSEVNLAGEERTKALINEIRERAATREITLAGYFNPRPMSFELLKNLTQARCEVRLTVDHVSDAILSRNGKNFRNHHLRTLVSHYAKLGTELSFSLLLGQPGETRKTVEEVLRFIEAIPTSIRGTFYFSPGVRVYPGTPIERGLKEKQLDKRWLVGRVCPEHPFVNPVVYCESWDPFELFEYVQSRVGGLLKPMNAYLSNLDIRDKVLIDKEFQNYHIGLAAMDEDPSTSLMAWSRVRPDTPFLQLKQRIEFLWARGGLALGKGLAMGALADWTRLYALLRDYRIDGATLRKLKHNINVAQRMLKVEQSPPEEVKFEGHLHTKKGGRSESFIMN